MCTTWRVAALEARFDELTAFRFMLLNIGAENALAMTASGL
jgi:hypothetical protein